MQLPNAFERRQLEHNRGLVDQVRVVLSSALHAECVTEPCAGALSDERLELPPLTVFVADLLTEATDGKQALQDANGALLLDDLIDQK